MQLNKEWQLFMTGKLTIVYKMSLQILLKMRFYYWKQRILVPVPHCTHHPKQLFRLSGLNRESYKVTNNRLVHGFYTGVPCGLVCIQIERFKWMLLTSILLLLPSVYDFGHMIIRSVLTFIHNWYFKLLFFKHLFSWQKRENIYYMKHFLFCHSLFIRLFFHMKMCWNTLF
jgi:hypothetical protein